MSPPSDNPVLSHPAKTVTALAARPDLPEDWRIWVGEEQLLRWVLDAACIAAASDNRRPALRHHNQGFPLSQLLALTAYCHLSGRFGSEAIAEELDRDPALRYLCAGRLPSATVLHRFRRQHRAALAATLRHALAAARAPGADRRRPVGAVPGFWGGSAGGSEPSDAWVARAAEGYLMRAALADTMAMDL